MLRVIVMSKTAKELIEFLQTVPPETEVKICYDSTNSGIDRIVYDDEWDWLPDSNDKVGKSLQKIGIKKVYLE